MSTTLLLAFLTLQTGSRVQAAWTPDAQLVVSRGGSVVWQGPITLQGTDPTSDADQWVDQTGAKTDSSVNTTTATIQKQAGKLTIRKNVEGDDVRLTVTVANQSTTNLRFVGIRLGESLGGAKTSVEDLGLLDFDAYQSASTSRFKFAWPSEWRRQRLWMWRTAAASYCLSVIAGKEPILCTSVSEPFFVVYVNVPPGGSKMLTLNLRVAAPNATLEHLAGRWKADVASELGPLLYQPDPRPVVEWIRYHYHHGLPVPAGNPQGWLNWRPDESEADATAWAEGVATNAKANGFQGAIAWGFCRGNPLAEMVPSYPIDGGDLTAQQRGWYERAFVAPFLAKGLMAGCLQRGAIQQQLRQDGEVVFSKADGGACSFEQMKVRLSKAGSLIYFDSTVGSEWVGTTGFETADLFGKLRQWAGPGPQWWMEFTYDLTWPYAGAYAPLGVDLQPSTTVRLMRLVYPTAGVLAKDVPQGSPAAFRQVCDARGYSALVADWRAGEAVPAAVPTPP